MTTKQSPEAGTFMIGNYLFVFSLLFIYYYYHYYLVVLKALGKCIECKSVCGVCVCVSVRIWFSILAGNVRHLKHRPHCYGSYAMLFVVVLFCPSTFSFVCNLLYVWFSFKVTLDIFRQIATHDALWLQIIEVKIFLKWWWSKEFVFEAYSSIH